MNFFSPIPNLVRRTVIDGNDKYFLQIITYCDQFNYRVDPNYTLSEEVDENGNFDVHINIIQDDNLPANTMILPLVHQIPLGTFSIENILINIKLTTEIQQNTESNKKPKGVVTISTASADEETRPIEAGRF